MNERVYTHTHAGLDVEDSGSTKSHKIESGPTKLARENERECECV